MSLSLEEKRELEWWSFIASYQEYKKDFEYLAQIIHANNCPKWDGQQAALKRAMYEEFLGVAVANHGRWQDMQKEGVKSQMPPPVYDTFAITFGKHIAEQNLHLLSEPCP